MLGQTKDTPCECKPHMQMASTFAASTEARAALHTPFRSPFPRTLPTAETRSLNASAWRNSVAGPVPLRACDRSATGNEHQFSLVHLFGSKRIVGTWGVGIGVKE